jgi:hypothetical protein|tara:strand:+ start:452 stop:682 length:231 start_codon:yes stop_codon:yes gene_type:complete
MAKIKNFNTYGKTSAEIWDQIIAAGVEVKLPFEAVGFRHTKELPVGIKLRDKDGKRFLPQKVLSLGTPAVIKKLTK